MVMKGGGDNAFLSGIINYNVSVTYNFYLGYMAIILNSIEVISGK